MDTEKITKLHHPKPLLKNKKYPNSKMKYNSQTMNYSKFKNERFNSSISIFSEDLNEDINLSKKILNEFMKIEVQNEILNIMKQTRNNFNQDLYCNCEIYQENNNKTNIPTERPKNPFCKNTISEFVEMKDVYL